MAVLLGVTGSGEREQDRAPQDETQGPAFRVEGEAMPISLEEYVRLVLARNLDLKIRRVDTQITSADAQGAEGLFDPEAYLDTSGSFVEIPAASRFSSSKTQGLVGAFGVRGLLRMGTQYDLNYSMQYDRQIDSNPFFTLNPRLVSSVLLSVTQPLLRGAGPTVTESEEQRDYLIFVQGDLNLRWTVEETAYAAVQAYWNLVFETRNLTTAQNALDVAEELVENNRRKQAAGVMTRLDVLTAQAEAARRRQVLIETETRLGIADDIFKALLSPGESREEWMLNLVPSTEPTLEEEANLDPVETVFVALEHRTDLSALDIDKEMADLALEVAENGLLPAFDLRGSFGFSGLGGAETVFGPDINGDGVPDSVGTSGDSNTTILGESLTPIGQGEFEQWSVGVSLSYPIGNHRARGDYRRAQLLKERSLLSSASLRTQIIRDCRAAVRNVQQAHAQVEAAQTARDLAEQEYAAENIRLDNQRSTTFQVREAQRDMFEARSEEIRAIVAYEIFLASLDQVQGLLGEKFGVVWTPVRRLEGAIE